MVCSVFVSDEAYEGLDDAVNYIANVLREPHAASQLLDSFDSFIERVGNLPDLYPFCAEPRLASQGVRKALIEGYVALYVVDKSAVVVVGFFHQSRDYAKLL